MLTAMIYLLALAVIGLLILGAIYLHQQEDNPGLTFRQWLLPFLRSLPARWKARRDGRADYDRPQRATGNADAPGPSGGAVVLVVPEPAAGPAPLPPPPATLPPAAAAPPGAPSAGGAQSDLLYAVDALVGEASHGDILAVRRVVSTLAEAAGGIGSAMVRLSTRLAEPDKDYGPEIWEPIATAGGQFNAGGLYLAESDAHALSLINTTVGEVAQSSRHAPHNSQLNGGA